MEISSSRSSSKNRNSFANSLNGNIYTNYEVEFDLDKINSFRECDLGIKAKKESLKNNFVINKILSLQLSKIEGPIEDNLNNSNNRNGMLWKDQISITQNRAESILISKSPKLDNLFKYIDSNILEQLTMANNSNKINLKSIIITKNKHRLENNNVNIKPFHIEEYKSENSIFNIESIIIERKKKSEYTQIAVESFSISNTTTKDQAFEFGLDNNIKAIHKPHHNQNVFNTLPPIYLEKLRKPDIIKINLNSLTFKNSPKPKSENVVASLGSIYIEKLRKSDYSLININSLTIKNTSKTKPENILTSLGSMYIDKLRKPNNSLINIGSLTIKNTPKQKSENILTNLHPIYIEKLSKPENILISIDSLTIKNTIKPKPENALASLCSMFIEKLYKPDNSIINIDSLTIKNNPKPKPENIQTNLNSLEIDKISKPLSMIMTFEPLTLERTLRPQNIISNLDHVFIEKLARFENIVLNVEFLTFERKPKPQNIFTNLDPLFIEKIGRPDNVQMNMESLTINKKEKPEMIMSKLDALMIMRKSKPPNIIINIDSMMMEKLNNPENFKIHIENLTIEKTPKPENVIIKLQPLSFSFLGYKLSKRYGYISEIDIQNNFNIENNYKLKLVQKISKKNYKIKQIFSKWKNLGLKEIKSNIITTIGMLNIIKIIKNNFNSKTFSKLITKMRLIREKSINGERVIKILSKLNLSNGSRLFVEFNRWRFQNLKNNLRSKYIQDKIKKILKQKEKNSLAYNYSNWRCLNNLSKNLEKYNLKEENINSFDILKSERPNLLVTHFELCLLFEKKFNFKSDKIENFQIDKKKKPKNRIYYSMTLFINKKISPKMQLINCESLIIKKLSKSELSINQPFSTFISKQSKPENVIDHLTPIIIGQNKSIKIFENKFLKNEKILHILINKNNEKMFDNKLLVFQNFISNLTYNCREEKMIHFSNKIKKYWKNYKFIMSLKRSAKILKIFYTTHCKLDLKMKIVIENKLKKWKANSDSLYYVKECNYIKSALKNRLNYIKNRKRLISYEIFSNLFGSYLSIKIIKKYFKEFSEEFRLVKASNLVENVLKLKIVKQLLNKDY